MISKDEYIRSPSSFDDLSREALPAASNRESFESSEYYANETGGRTN